MATNILKFSEHKYQLSRDKSKKNRKHKTGTTHTYLHFVIFKNTYTYYELLSQQFC